MTTTSQRRCLLQAKQRGVKPDLIQAALIVSYDNRLMRLGE